MSSPSPLFLRRPPFLFPPIAGVWRAQELAPVKALSTGHPALDALLPGGGWPIGALTEVIPLTEGIGEMAILQAALKQLCQQSRRIIFVHPPYIPYAPALLRAGLSLSQVLWIDALDDEEAHWAAEQTLREAAAGAVLLWSQVRAERPLRRLQLAAESGQSLAFLYRPAAALDNGTPAALRILLRPSADALDVKVLKVRGGRCAEVHLALQKRF